jgi:hypothetical protein
MSSVAYFFVGVLIGKVLGSFQIRKIEGCYGDLYMTRIILFRTQWFKLMVNIFHRSDDDRALHDHPWHFWSFILWRGYIEHTAEGAKRIRPFQLIHRNPWWTHRVELVKSPAVTLVVTGRKVREWGFHTKKGWMHWKKFGREHCNDGEELQ